MTGQLQKISSQDSWIHGTGGRLFVRVWSPELPDSTTPICLLHDSLGSVELWRDFPEQLCAHTGRQVIAYDRLGFGKSDARHEKLPIDFVAREAEGDFAAVRQQLGIGSFIVFGHSVGGGMAIHCAATFGDDCVAVITESAQAFVEDKTVQGIEAARALFTDPEQVSRLRKYHGEKAAWILDAWIGTWLSPAFASWSLRSVLPQLTSPLLVLHGRDDEYGSTRHPELLGQLAGGTTEVVIIDDTRHVPHREREACVVDLVARFLRSHD
ncbi:alpha/beta hydrolase [Actimicrobium antarcticum]|uniref:Alpha/beta hydrolase n=1 Tax=Actimicrobium antarcticum TaxID=1051899 RepID=A0ABP7SS72_9BURK